MNLEQALEAAGGPSGWTYYYKGIRHLAYQKDEDENAVALYPPATIHKALALMAGEDFEAMLDAYANAILGDGRRIPIRDQIARREAARTAILDYVAAKDARIAELTGLLSRASGFIKQHYEPAVDSEFSLHTDIQAELARLQKDTAP